MKRTATTLALLAGFSGGCMSTDAKNEPAGGFGTVSRGMQVPGVMGPNGEPVMAARAAMPSGSPSGVMQAGGKMPSDSKIQQAALFKSADGDCASCAHVPGASASLFGPHFGKHSGGGGGYGGGMPAGQFPAAVSSRCRAKDPPARWPRSAR